MALPNLASASDLAARDVTASTVMLAVASSIVRGAAGSPILETDSTVTLTGWGERVLRLPGLPVTAVASVEVDGTALAATAYKFIDNASLWRACGWGYETEPASVEVTMTHGFAEVPEQIKQLVIDLAVAGETAAETGAIDPRIASERIDDYTVTFVTGAEAVATAMELPKATRAWLRSAFGGGAGVVSYR